MKIRFPAQFFLAIFWGPTLFAQPTLEFAAGGGPAASGSTIASQVITWQNNTNNPLGNTFSAFTPTTTVTFTLSNQQYALSSSQNSNRAGVSFGGTSNASGQSIGSFPQYASLNAVSGATAGLFSSLPSTIGSGISIISNYGTELFTSAMGLYNASAATNGRYYMADLTVTFSQPVVSPVLSLVGVGGTFGSGGSTLGFTSELELQTPGVVMSELSGSPELSVSAGKILNSAVHPSATTGSGAASGSILLTGVNITQLVFKIYFRGDGGYFAWANASEHTGDAWLLSFSELSTSVVLPVRLNDFVATKNGDEALLQWSTASEEGLDHFGVERSLDGLNWDLVGRVGAVGGPSDGFYTYTDHAPVSGNDLYRLVLVDQDSSVTYSSIAAVSFSLAGAARVVCFPNPTQDRVTLVMPGDGSGVYSASVLSMAGKVLDRVTGLHSGGSIDLGGYPAGVYILRVQGPGGYAQTIKIQRDQH